MKKLVVACVLPKLIQQKKALRPKAAAKTKCLFYLLITTTALQLYKSTTLQINCCRCLIFPKLLEFYSTIRILLQTQMSSHRETILPVLSVSLTFAYSAFDYNNPPLNPLKGTLRRSFFIDFIINEAIYRFHYPIYL